MDTYQSPIKLKLNETFVSTQPTILIGGLLRAGEYQFQLEVLDEKGTRSRAAIITLRVNPAQSPWQKLQSKIASWVGYY